jgi:hypothetical protein
MKFEILSGSSIVNGPEMVSVLHEFSGDAQDDPFMLLSGGVSQTKSPSFVQSLFKQLVP